MLTHIPWKSFSAPGLWHYSETIPHREKLGSHCCDRARQKSHQKVIESPNKRHLDDQNRQSDLSLVSLPVCSGLFLTGCVSGASGPKGSGSKTPCRPDWRSVMPVIPQSEIAMRFHESDEGLGGIFLSFCALLAAQNDIRILPKLHADDHSVFLRRLRINTSFLQASGHCYFASVCVCVFGCTPLWVSSVAVLLFINVNCHMCDANSIRLVSCWSLVVSVLVLVSRGGKP